MPVPRKATPISAATAPPGTTSSAAVRASHPALLAHPFGTDPELLGESACSHLSTVGRLTLLGMAGMALFGATIGAASARPVQPTAPQMVAVAVARAPETGMPRFRLSDGSDKDHPQGEKPCPPRLMLLSGQDSRKPDNAEWKTYKGTVRGQTFSIQYPPGWKVQKTYFGILVTSPENNQVGITFNWYNGAGEITPEGLIQMVARENGVSDYRALTSQREAPGQSPVGPVEGVKQDCTYTQGGVPQRGRVHALVTVNRGYVSLWYGAVTAFSAPKDQWARYEKTLQQIADSFNADVNQE
ncbi:MAG TPA: hypothetical protein VNO81_09760 [Candidatus Nitrosotenuis sp.]|nr:hypothetical protein [Candidatus Nitrosotenuis sp.]